MNLHFPKIKLTPRSLIWPGVIISISIVTFSFGLTWPQSIAFGVTISFGIIFSNILLKKRDYQRFLLNLGSSYTLTQTEKEDVVIGLIPYKQSKAACFILGNDNGLIIGRGSISRLITWANIESSHELYFYGQPVIELTLKNDRMEAPVFVPCTETIRSHLKAKLNK